MNNSMTYIIISRKALLFLKHSKLFPVVLLFRTQTVFIRGKKVQKRKTGSATFLTKVMIFCGGTLLGVKSIEDDLSGFLEARMEASTDSLHLFANSSGNSANLSKTH